MPSNFQGQTGVETLTRRHVFLTHPMVQHENEAEDADHAEVVR